MAAIAEAITIALKHHQSGELEQAAQIYRRVLEVNPQHADALHLLGVAHNQRGQHGHAVELICRAIALQPSVAEMHNNLAVALRALGRLDEADSHYQRALSLNPDYAEAHLNLGNVLQQKRRADEAIDCYRRALKLKPDLREAHEKLGQALQYFGEPQAALRSFDSALKAAPSKFGRLAHATVLPIIYESVEQVREYRQRLTGDLNRLVGDGFQVDPIQERIPTWFYLAYQGENDRAIHEQFSRICSGSSVDLTPERSDGMRLREDRIRIGFVSCHFRQHTITAIWGGLIGRLSRERFDVTVFSIGASDDQCAADIRSAADVYVELSKHPRDLPSVRETIAEAELDILFYTDIGMDSSTYALANCRLAPVQCVTWGHPVTTGLPTIDYFISSELLESEEADSHYTEKLVRLRTLGVYVPRPKTTASQKCRAEYGLPEGKHLYGCLQSLFKLHPNFDEILAGILRRDPDSLLVLSNGICPHWNELLRRRFQHSMPDVIGRVRFVPRQEYDDFLKLNTLMDVLLVPPQFGGGRTSYDALALGMPVVTMPTQLLRGRITYGLYRAMNVFDCVAATQEEYVAIAVRLGTDADFRREVCDKIQHASHRLFDDAEAIGEMGSFLESVSIGMTTVGQPTK